MGHRTPLRRALALLRIIAPLVFLPGIGPAGPAAAPAAAPAARAAHAPAAASPAPPAADGRSALDELRRDLRDSRPETRRAAVRRLAELGTRAGWELLVGALADEDGRVADEAQVRLEGLDDPRVLRSLLGPDGLRARDSWVRLRAAEALGRSRLPVAWEPLVACVGGREVELACTALWSLERLARRDGLQVDGKGRGEREPRPERLVKKLGRIADGRLPGRVRAHALLALQAVDPEAARARASAAAGAREPELRCAALELARESDEPPPAALVALLADPAPSVRAKAVLELVPRASRALALALADRLEAEERPRLRRRALDGLRALSGLHHRADPRPWRHWASGLAADWRAGSARPVASAEREADRRRSRSDHRLPVLSDRLCLLVDFSGSLWHELSDGRSRKEVTDRLVGEALDALPDGARFNLVPYTDEPFPWSRELCTLDRRRREDARRFFERCRQRGKGDLFGAVESVWDEAELDSLLIVTDGAPTGGRRWNLDLMVELLRHGTRFAPLAFDLVVVDAAPRLQRRWREFAAATGGTFAAFDLESVKPGDPERAKAR